MTGDGATAERPRYRAAVRALLMDPEDGAVLLLHARFPGWKRSRWLVPGGGIDARETPLDALVREVHEETGRILDRRDVVPAPVWRRRVPYAWQGVHYDQEEHFFLVPSARFEPDTANNPATHETEALLGFDWWTPQAMTASQEQFIPRALAGALAALHRGERPTTPIDVGP